MLGVPTDEGTYYLDNDASDVGLGSVLSQRQGEREVVIAYASRTLSKSERNYDVTKRELLAVVFGLKTYRQYLCGRRFVVRTDHSAIQWLRRTPEPMAQMARWLNFVEEFQFDIEHRSGVRHGNADGLSRRPTDVPDNGELHVRATDCLRTNSEPVSAPHATTDSVEEFSLSEMQLRDPEIGFVLRSLLESAERPDPNSLVAASAFVKLLCSQWELLQIVDGVLYRRFSYNDGRPDVLQLLVPLAMRKDFLEKVHSGMNGGHLGIRRTPDQVRRRAFWPGWRGDVRRHCKQCQNCNGYFRGQLPRSGPLQPMLAGQPFERMHLDITGPHPKSRRGSVCIVTIVDAFSKWADAFPIANRDAATVARILVEQVICRFGCPLSLLTDNARELEGELMTEVCRLLGVDKLPTTVFKASTNATVERFHRTLNSMMGRMLENHERDWDLMLPYVMAAYRNSRHESTDFTPNFLILGREVHAPIDLVYGVPESTAPNSYDAYVDEMKDRFTRAYALVREHLGQAAKRTKRYYDMRVKPKLYHVGDWVYYFNPRKRPGRHEKWAMKYTGTFLVIKVIGPVNVVIQHSKRATPMTVHVDKLKPFVADEMPKSWLESTDIHVLADNVFDGGVELSSDKPAAETSELETLVKQRLEPVSEEFEPVNAVEVAAEAEAGGGERGATITPEAMAGVPAANFRSPRPRREVRRPRRFQD